MRLSVYRTIMFLIAGFFFFSVVALAQQAQGNVFVVNNAELAFSEEGKYPSLIL